MVAMSPLSGWLLGRWGGRLVLLSGAALMALAYAGRLVYAESVTAVVIGSTLVGIGTALAFAAMPTLIMSSVPITKTASANGLNSLVRSVGTSLASTLVAVIMATHQVEIAGNFYATDTAFQLVLGLGALAAATCAAVAALIPRDRRTHRELELARAQGQEKHEAVVRGQIRLARSDNNARDDAGISARHARRTAGLEPGRQRRPLCGGAARPGHLRGGREHPRLGTVRHRDRLRRRRDRPGHHPRRRTHRLRHRHLRRRLAPGALVALSEAMGKHIDSTHCDDRGRYSFQLPPTGRYVLIAYDAPTGRAHARKVSLTIESEVVDIAIPLAGTNRSADRRDSDAVAVLPWEAPATHT